MRRALPAAGLLVTLTRPEPWLRAAGKQLDDGVESRHAARDVLDHDHRNRGRAGSINYHQRYRPLTRPSGRAFCGNAFLRARGLIRRKVEEFNESIGSMGE